MRWAILTPTLSGYFIILWRVYIMKKTYEFKKVFTETSITFGKIYLCERMIKWERERQIFQSLVHFPYGSNSHHRLSCRQVPRTPSWFPTCKDLSAQVSAAVFPGTLVGIELGVEQLGTWIDVLFHCTAKLTPKLNF